MFGKLTQMLRCLIETRCVRMGRGGLPGSCWAIGTVLCSDNYFNARNMDVYVKRLRKLLCEDPSVKLENVHGVGYKLVIEAV